jgi:hypothetical protein
VSEREVTNMSVIICNRSKTVRVTVRIAVGVAVRVAVDLGLWLRKGSSLLRLGVGLRC